jgi:hypothetical protein
MRRIHVNTFGDRQIAYTAQNTSVQSITHTHIQTYHCGIGAVVDISTRTPKVHQLEEISPLSDLVIYFLQLFLDKVFDCFDIVSCGAFNSFDAVKMGGGGGERLGNVGNRSVPLVRHRGTLLWGKTGGSCAGGNRVYAHVHRSIC